MDLSKLSGLELIELYVSGKIPPPEIANTMPMKGLSYGDGFVNVLVRADKRHINPFGFVSGGFSATVMDASIANAILTKLPPGQAYITIDFAIKFINPIPIDEDFTVKANVISMTKRLAFGEAVICDGDGKKYAHATATCSIIRGKKVLL